MTVSLTLPQDFKLTLVYMDLAVVFNIINSQVVYACGSWFESLEVCPKNMPNCDNFQDRNTRGTRIYNNSYLV